MRMKIIRKNNEFIYLINKSKFIGLCFKVEKKEEIESILHSLKEKYSDATHICYAYILPNTQKYSDDNEPSNTAGKPILEVLEKNNLNYVLGVVIRYFGGIKLGAGGLVRAYTKAIAETINNNTKDMEIGYLVNITIDYSKSKDIEIILKDETITNKHFDNQINIQAIIHKKTLEKLSNVNYQIISETII